MGERKAPVKGRRKEQKPSTKRYPPELRERAVRMVTETNHERDQRALRLWPV